MDISKGIVGPGWPVTYNGDGLATIHNADFTQDPLFEASYERRFYLLDTYDEIPLQQLTDAERDEGIELHNNFYFDCYEGRSRLSAATPTHASCAAWCPIRSLK